ncbi:B-box domain protein 30-like [Malania oleifera]|uniref:B-box domain protein 30-like n=1 Tax=Malania oleifera TaxID=397392 RepID=UPI0025AE925C|nr:B-box domain protein 30-like [Malania oleifera]
MCRGREEEGRQQREFGQSEIPPSAREAEAEAVSAHDGFTNFVGCELCRSQASLYCEADDAFLCRKCDKSVHGANFLALRHVRCFLCTTCQNLTHHYLIGTSAEVGLRTLLSWVHRTTQKCNNNSNLKKKRKRSRVLKKRPFLFP